MIRPITPDDIEWINKNYKADMYTIGLASVFHKVSHDAGFWNPGYVYEYPIEGNNIIGGFITGESDSYRSYGEVKNLYIFENSRRQGIGTKLLKKLEEYYKSIGLYSCEIVTFTDKAKDFYLKNGYELVADYEKKYHKNDKYTRRVLLYKIISNTNYENNE